VDSHGIAALGIKVRTGKAILVVLAGPKFAPSVAAKTIIQVAFTFKEGAVFHAAQDMSPAHARAHVEQARLRFTALARDEIRAWLTEQNLHSPRVQLAAPAPKATPSLDAILRSHPRVHAAEIELYRSVFADACKALALAPTRAGASAAGVASKLGWSPKDVTEELARIGKSAGTPWTVHQKEAALAAWSALC